MRVLVTGAAGFVGRALLARLATRAAWEVHALDRNSRGDVNQHICDMREAGRVSRVVRAVAPDCIYHLAGAFAETPTAHFADNVEISRNLLEAVRLSNSRSRVLLIGSAAEYGDVRRDANPLREDLPLRPASGYGRAKACQTRLMDHYRRRHDLDIVMARLFNLFGAGASRQLFVGHVEQQIEQLRRGLIGEIVVGNLDAIRDYLPVDKAAAYLECIMERGARGEVYNVGSGEPVSMRDLLERILTCHGIAWDKVRIESRAARGNSNVPCVYADISKLRALNCA
jgi:nucleoside-diphosphate-sugar epimerase